MNELSLFSGAGGGILGAHLLEWRTVCAVEFDEYARNVLIARQDDGILPPFPIWDDIRTFDGRPWVGLVDVITGGFPCQAFSTAASGKNIAANLWPEMLRVVGQICPRYVFSENVSEDAIVEAQADLADLGYSTCRGMFGACHVGADHIRERWWVVADANHEGKLGRYDNAKVAFQSKGGSSIWEAKPNNSRVDDGLARRVDRFKAIGNGQIPAVAQLAWGSLSRFLAT